MQCILIYNNNIKISITPINIIFQQKYHQYGQLYIICPIYIENPQKIEIKNLFIGEFIFSHNLQNNTKSIYFCNTNFKIDSNEILYLDSYKNTLISKEIPEIFQNFLHIYNLDYQIINHLPKYLEISHQYILNVNGLDILHKDIISHEFENGIGYRKISFQQIDAQYIKSLIQHMIFSTRSLEIKCFLCYENIRMGYIITINDVKYQISFIYHNFLKQITILKCHIYIREISFTFCDSIKVESKIKQINSMEIITPYTIENHYSISIDTNIQYLFH